MCHASALIGHGCSAFPGCLPPCLVSFGSPSSSAPDLAQAYNNVGCTYGDLGNHRKALEYHQKALAIWENVLPPEHPHLALSFNNIACTYHNLGDFQSAAKFMRRVADIIERSDLPKTHPNRVNYPQWAEELAKKAEMQRKLLNQTQFPFPKK